MRGRQLWELVAGPALLFLAVAAVGGVLLLAPLDTDGSYTCSGTALSRIVSPEPDNPSIREVAFDSAAACNHTARSRGLVAAVVIGLGLTGSGGWVVVRRRSGMQG